jgi:CO/xanthine dehydrogenase FAD-binding subunit
MQAHVARGAVTDARVVYFGCVERAAVARNVSSAMIGLDLSSRDVDYVVDAAAADLSPDDTPGWRSETKLKLAQTVTRRALQQLAGAAA